MSHDGVNVEMRFGKSLFDDPVGNDWTYISSYVRTFKTQRGRMHELNKIEAGIATIEVNNVTGDFWRYNTAGAFYVTAGKEIVKPLTPIRIYVNFNSTDYPIFYGMVESFTPDWVEDRGGRTPIMKIGCVDLFKLLSKSQIYQGGAALGYDFNVTTDYSGQRILKVLDYLSYFIPGLGTTWPMALRNLDNGKILVSPLSDAEIGTNGKNALEYLQKVADAESGYLFISADGKVTFQDRDSRWTTFGTSTATFDTYPANYLYVKPELADDDSFIYNAALVNYNGANVAQWQDSTNMGLQGVRLWQNTDGVIYQKVDAQNQATLWVARYSDSVLRVKSLDIMPNNSPAYLYPLVLGSDVSTRITLNLNDAYNPGAVPNKQYHVEGIEHEWHADGKDWTTHWQLWDSNQYEIMMIKHDGDLVNSPIAGSYAGVQTGAIATSVQNDGVGGGSGIFVGQLNQAGLYSIGRGFLQFDTTTVTQTIKQAWVVLEVTQIDANARDFDLTLVQGNTVNQPLINTDYHVLLGETTSLGAYTIDHTLTSSTSRIILIPIQNPNVNVNKGGLTSYGLRSSKDISASAPGVSTYEDITISNILTSGYAPRLLLQF